MRESNATFFFLSGTSSVPDTGLSKDKVVDNASALETSGEASGGFGSVH